MLQQNVVSRDIDKTSNSQKLQRRIRMRQRHLGARATVMGANLRARTLWTKEKIHPKHTQKKTKGRMRMR